MNEIVTVESEPAVAAVPAMNGLASGLKPHLAKALQKAQGICKPVPKDSTNAYHNYKYASAEAVIEEGKRALADAELSLVPISQAINGHQKEGENRYEMVRQFLLMHSSGEFLPLSVAWPVCPEKGRPLDKAAAIAATLSLSYFLRDLLLMPRVNPSDDLAGSHDLDREPPARQLEPTPTPVKTKREKEPKSAPTILTDKIAAAVNELHIDWKAFGTRLKEKYGVDSTAKLSTEQANEVLMSLEDKIAQNSKVH